MNLSEKTINSKTIYNGRIFSVRQDTVELQNGSTATRDIVAHSGGVGVIAVLDDGKIPVVRQYRKGIESVCLEIPAGKSEEGEDPETCGRRELSEETGYSAEKFTLISRFAVSPAYCSEIIHIYKAEDLSFTGQHLDENEYLNVEYYTLDELFDMVATGEIVDAKTVIAVMILKSEK